MTTDEALARVRVRMGDAYADEIEVLMARGKAANDGLRAILTAHFGSMETTYAVADGLLSKVGLRAHR